MGWTSPRTWVAGAVVTAAQLNAHLRDNLAALLPLDQVAWTSYTPTLTQSASVTKTVNYAKYTQIGKLVVVRFSLSPTGAGSANNKITVSLPVTAASSSNIEVGVGRVVDASVPSTLHCITRMDSTTTVGFVNGSNGNLVGATGSGIATALASGDEVTGGAIYEAA
jgi:hypothetical protein